jgi:hypothetical protein
MYHLVPFFFSTPQPIDTNATPWRDSMEALAESARFCRRGNIRFVVFLYRLYHEPRTDAIFESIRKVTETEHFPVADVAPWFSGIRPRSVVNSLVDSHPNTKGHAILARRIADSLVQFGGVPSHINVSTAVAGSGR